MTEQALDWFDVGAFEDLPEGCVKSVAARNRSISLSHFNGQWTAMNNHCPHQGGPLGVRQTDLSEPSTKDGQDQEIPPPEIWTTIEGFLGVAGHNRAWKLWRNDRGLGAAGKK